MTGALRTFEIVYQVMRELKDSRRLLRRTPERRDNQNGRKDSKNHFRK